MSRTIRRSAAMLPLAFAAAIANAQSPQDRANQDPVVEPGSHMLEGYISEDALQVLYGRELDLDEVGRTDVHGGIFFNEERDLILIADGLARLGSPEEVRRLTLSVGPRAYGAFLNTENDDIFGIGLGGEARYYFNTEQTTSLALTAFYAPDIIVFGNADNVSDVGLRFETRLRGDTQVFVGYRSFEIDLAGVDREVDDNLHIGFKSEF